jgi:protein involved in polysaccharide export with SLBB domain
VTRSADTEASADYLRPGQKIVVEFSDIPSNPGSMSQTIREDGMIGLPLGVSIKAAGLTRGELIEQIEKAYVPKFYKRLSVNIKSDELYFSVGGEVKNPSQRPYLGQTTVLQAIQSAGDYTDFANKKKIEVTRTSGKKFTVNGLKAAQDRSLDLPIFPGDRIIVPRRLF